MKYPQLVSSRAVSEISDWLIRRLEDLDIEQPSVYSRLLLSLLHTPFKLNAIDLLEIPQLKVNKNRFIRKLLHLVYNEADTHKCIENSPCNALVRTNESGSSYRPQLIILLLLIDKRLELEMVF